MKTVDDFLTTWNDRESPKQTALVNPNTKIFNNLHVVLSKSGRNDYTLRINYIKSLKRKKGELKKFMKWITAQATKSDFTLSMAVQPCTRHFEESVPKEKLKEIAERYGFTVKFEYPDLLGYEMIREPVK